MRASEAPSEEAMWEKIKAVPPFIASIVAIVAAVLAAVTWVGGYFATKSSLEHVRCISDKNEELLAQQILASGYYSGYIQKNVKIMNLESVARDQANARLIPATQNRELAELKAAAAIDWEKLDAANKRADDIAAFLRAGRCSQ